MTADWPPSPKVVAFVKEAAQAAMDELNTRFENGLDVLGNAVADGLIAGTGCPHGLHALVDAAPNPYDPLVPDMPHKPDVSDL